ncbi:MAG: hypothetical protein Q9227_005795 [Pyrenula ochraceoflavens]
MAKAWTDTDNVRLLLAILKTHDLKLDYQAVTNEMGDGRSALAISKHIIKLKDKMKAESGLTPATPSKSGRGRKPENGTKTASGKRVNAGEDVKEEDQDEVDMDGSNDTPSKKRKMEEETGGMDTGVE